ncbi:uncharacterized protein LY89DRAFT_742540 [Mollisia scopiformis]|uniref:Copper acquisition factor BIM1-like domain-containing protein n=1 Tax=Mollisia scopiformis TaxID=149040 RepID=A0A132B7V9_MOLSC|nr:uncharacterized protein LY89DRAFT_742540 [Mollisia scopiformis]KUJ07767.1 hypothetical protein LY89DRAFT_742540 [Mollisia scopiformis]
MLRLTKVSLFATIWAVSTAAHTVITYPGWRGNNLVLNETFLYGMQWSYPCGGLPATTNRTKWPITGGGIAVQPGWFTGHASALFYINLGLGTAGPQGGPPNESFPMLPPFQIDGPSDNPYPGTFCLPQVPLPANVTVNVGDEATIQVIETAIHGGALYNCADIIFAEESDVTPLTVDTCFNGSTITFKDPFAAEASPTTAPANSSSTCAISTSVISATCPTQTACPQCNGDSSLKEGLGVGFPLGVLALGVLGL